MQLLVLQYIEVFACGQKCNMYITTMQKVGVNIQKLDVCLDTMGRKRNINTQRYEVQV